MAKSYDKFYKNKRILITGGLGFTGSTLAHFLVPLGAKVTIVDSLIPDLGGNFFNLEGIRDKVKINISDIRDKLAMNYIVKEQEIIFNIAGTPSHLDSMVDSVSDYDINVRGQLNFLEACRHHNKKVKIVYLGSRSQYGAVKENPFKEDVLMMPKDIYGANKLAAEFFHFYYQKYYGIETTSIRMGPGYGPRCQMKHAKYGVLNFLLRTIMDGNQITIYGDGGQLRDSIYVDDAVEAMLAAGATKKSAGQAYNIGSGRALTFKDQVKTLIKACGLGKYRHVPWPKERARIEVGDSIADISKIKKGLGWEPKTKLLEGAKRTYSYYKDFKEYYW